MHLKAMTLAAAIAAGAAFVPLAASANVLPAATPAQSVAADSSMVQQASRRCWVWRNECASRWGWGGWRFRRCMIRHGC